VSSCPRSTCPGLSGRPSRRHVHRVRALGCLERILASIQLPCEVLVVYDSPDDTTVPWIEKCQQTDPRVTPVLNLYGGGPARVIPVRILPSRRRCRRGDDVGWLRRSDADRRPCPPSRPGRRCRGSVAVYARGTTDRWADLKELDVADRGTLSPSVRRVGTRDDTNSFKAYSTEIVRSVGIDSDEGFEVASNLSRKPGGSAFRWRRSLRSGSNGRTGERANGQSNQISSCVNGFPTTSGGIDTPSARGCLLKKFATIGTRPTALPEPLQLQFAPNVLEIYNGTRRKCPWR